MHMIQLAVFYFFSLKKNNPWNKNENETKRTPIILKSDWAKRKYIFKIVVIFYGNENPFKESTMVYKSSMYYEFIKNVY